MSKIDTLLSFWLNDELPNTHRCYSMLVHLYDFGPVLKQHVQQLAYNSSIPR